MIIIPDGINTNTSQTRGLAVNGRNRDFDNKDRKGPLHKICASVSDEHETIKIIFKVAVYGSRREPLPPKEPSLFHKIKRTCKTNKNKVLRIKMKGSTWIDHEPQ